MLSLQVLLAVVARTHRIQTGPSAISLEQLPDDSEIIVGIHQGSGYLPGSSSVCPDVSSSTHEVSAVLLHKNLVNLCDALAFTVLVPSEYSAGAV